MTTTVIVKTTDHPAQVTMYGSHNHATDTCSTSSYSQTMYLQAPNSETSYAAHDEVQVAVQELPVGTTSLQPQLCAAIGCGAADSNEATSEKEEANG